ncbi:MAG: hypothetical protein LBL59_11435 [Xanthomonadaceae bacterium]|jgi:hypothetical protein|nr:hypothetical protein [Xanthomonadaceae bacterium]
MRAMESSLASAARVVQDKVGSALRITHLSLYRYNMLVPEPAMRYSVNLSADPIQGTWKLRIVDGSGTETNYNKTINSRDIAF